MDYKKKYNKIINELIKKSFPSLRGVKIIFFEFEITNLYGLYTPFNFIGLNKKCRSFSDKQIKGILVHELCHAEFAKKKGLTWTFSFFLFYWIFSRLRIDEEIRADEEVIKKGYAKELFEITKRIEKDYGLDNIKYGLSSKEIKEHAKKIRKW